MRDQDLQPDLKQSSVLATLKQTNKKASESAALFLMNIPECPNMELVSKPTLYTSHIYFLLLTKTCSLVLPLASFSTTAAL